MNRGRWGGEQLLPESYFTRFATPLVPNEMPLSVAAAPRKYLLIGTWGNQFTFDVPFGPGIYGSHWWFNSLVGPTTSRHWPGTPPDTFAAIGSYPEKAIFVIPSLRMVVAAHGGWSSGSYDTPPLEGSRGQLHRYWAPGDPEGGLNEQLKRLAAAAR